MDTKMKKLRTASFLLALLISASSCSCGGSVDDDPKVTGSETQTSETTADALSDGLDGLNFGGKQINIFCTNYGDSKGFQYFFAEEETGDIVIDSVYRRNRTVEERLGVKLGYTEFAFGWDEKDQMYNAVRSGIMADDNGFDIICMPTYFVSTMIVEGLFGDLSSLPHVDFSKPWWSEDFIETATISGKTYLAAGDGTLPFLTGINCIAFNKKLATDFSVPDIYDTVFDGKWTFDCLNSTIKGIYSDLNGNSTAVKDKEDRWGLEIFGGNNISCFETSCEAPCIVNKNGKYEFVYDSERNVEVFDMLVQLVHQNEDVVFYGQDSIQVPESAFGNGNSLFATISFAKTSTMRDLKFDWGVISYPKYDESQEKYHTRASSGTEVFQIPVTSSGREDVGAVLEALSSEGYKSLTPAYYETALKVKYTNGDKTSEMLDLIKDSASIEFALVFASAIGAPTDQFKNAVGSSSNKGGWASTVASLKLKTVGLLEDMLAAIETNN